MPYASPTQPEPSTLRSGDAIDRQVLEFVLACYHAGQGWWGQRIPGTRLTMRDHVMECRKRYGGRRSVASLDSDAKSKPFPRSSNIGIGAEQMFGEFLIPVLLANTRDLDPQLQVVDEQTDQVDDPRTAFHNAYQKRLMNRKLVEYSTREVLTVGSCYHKVGYQTIWRQQEQSITVYENPVLGGPLLQLDPQTGHMRPQLVDPHLPEAVRPVDPSGRPLPVITVPSVAYHLEREGPSIGVVTAEAMLFPPKTTEVDPQQWDWAIHVFEVSPWWFVGREGNPWEGKLQNLPLLWRYLGVEPSNLYSKPSETMARSVRLAEYHGPFAVTQTGSPVEIIALVAPEASVLLGWRLTIFPQRPFIHRQVWNRGEFPLGIGIPESVRGERDYLDASVNQDADAGNLYNHPPVLFSDLAKLDDEQYELMGPGTQWTLRDVHGARMLPVVPSTRNPIERENWILSMMQRKWGVTDLNLSAPTSALSPNISTATGVISVLNQGSIKFGHLTKRLAETDTQEYQLFHDCLRTMLSNPFAVAEDGKPVVIRPEDREEFFSRRYRVTAVGNGITTNPTLRQQIIGQTYAEMVASKNPFVAGDLEVLKELTEDLLEARGLSYALKDPQVLQQMRLFLEVMHTDAGRALVPQAMRQAIQQHQQAAMAAQGVEGGNGANRLA